MVGVKDHWPVGLAVELDLFLKSPPEPLMGNGWVVGFFLACFCMQVAQLTFCVLVFGQGILDNPAWHCLEISKGHTVCG